VTAPTGLRGSDGLPIALGPQVGQAGGEGAVYAVLDRAPASVAKIFKQPPAQGGAKLRAMIAAPPRGAPLDGEQPALTWPRELVLDAAGQVVGYLMARLDDSAVEFTEMSDPRFRADVRTATNRPFDWHDLHIVAANLAGVVAACHAASYVLGDLNPKNVRVHPTGQVTLIDTDSFQVTIGSTVHHCGVFRAEYLAPELFGKELHTHTRAVTSDLHSLAVLLYKVLQDGDHPFMGKDTEAEEPPAPVDFVQRRVYPLDQRRPHPNIGPNPRALPLGRLHPALIDLFQRTFGPGLTAPHQRATAAQWAKALSLAQQDLRGCRGGHLYAATPGRICLHRTNAGYCGATMQADAVQPMSIDFIDALTGLHRDEQSVVAPSENVGSGGSDTSSPRPSSALQSRTCKVQVRIDAPKGRVIPAGTKITLVNSSEIEVYLKKRESATASATFTVLDLPSGSYVLDVQNADGFYKTTKNVNLAAEDLYIRFTMEPLTAWPVITIIQESTRPSVTFNWRIVSGTRKVIESGSGIMVALPQTVTPQRKFWPAGSYRVECQADGAWGSVAAIGSTTVKIDPSSHGPTPVTCRLAKPKSAAGVSAKDAGYGNAVPQDKNDSNEARTTASEALTSDPQSENLAAVATGRPTDVVRVADSQNDEGRRASNRIKLALFNRIGLSMRRVNVGVGRLDPLNANTFVTGSEMSYRNLEIIKTKKVALLENLPIGTYEVRVSDSNFTWSERFQILGAKKHETETFEVSVFLQFAGKEESHSENSNPISEVPKSRRWSRFVKKFTS
jgi:serine/threonine protein kinase